MVLLRDNDRMSTHNGSKNFRNKVFGMNRIVAPCANYLREESERNPLQPKIAQKYMKLVHFLCMKDTANYSKLHPGREIRRMVHPSN